MDEGEFVAMMGASGSGKTTLLNCIATIDVPTGGFITIGDKEITKIKEDELADFRKDNLGFIFQDFNLLDTMTIEENIALSLIINKADSMHIDERVEAMAAKLGISDILKKFPYEVSGGQKQRCACARALINNPKIILADEPTGALDSKSSRMLLETMEQMNRELKATILMVTHDSFSASFCERVLFLKDGKIFNEIVKGEKQEKSFLTKLSICLHCWEVTQTMLGKLAVRNVKRSAKDYVIYLITIIISFSLIFALNLISTSEAIMNLSQGLNTFQYIMYFINAIVLGVICFLINYTTKFIFEKRSKEFGMYALLGIKKRKINKMFLLESLLLGFIALIISMPVGFCVSQFLSLFIVKILELPQAIFIGLNVKSFVLLAIYFALIYLLVLWRAGRRMRKSTINDLLTLEKQNEMKITKSKKHRNILFFISAALGIFSLIVWYVNFKPEAVQESSILSVVLICLCLLVVSIYGIMISAGDFILSVVLKNNKIKNSKDNLFIARTFSAKAKTMGFVFGTLSMLITLSILFLNISGMNKGLYDYQIDSESPFDVAVTDKKEHLKDYLDIIEEDYTIKNDFIYDIYKDKTAAILKTTPAYDYKSDERRFDPVIRLSDYNRLLELRGQEK